MIYRMVYLRVAEKSELAWVNKCYEEVHFVSSSFEKELIAIAEIEGQKVGLGRLVTWGDKLLELGGIYVFESCRGKGIAKEIVSFLLRQARGSQTIYCIPFEHLSPFYQQFGFVPCLSDPSLPAGLLEKQRWSATKYPHPTTLLVLSK